MSFKMYFEREGDAYRKIASHHDGRLYTSLFAVAYNASIEDLFSRRLHNRVLPHESIILVLSAYSHDMTVENFHDNENIIIEAISHRGILWLSEQTFIRYFQEV